MISISVCNYSLTETQTLDVAGEFGDTIAEARYITADKVDAHNDFEHPENITIKDFDGAKLVDGQLSITILPMSVATVRISE